MADQRGRTSQQHNAHRTNKAKPDHTHPAQSTDPVTLGKALFLTLHPSFQFTPHNNPILNIEAGYASIPTRTKVIAIHEAFPEYSYSQVASLIGISAQMVYQHLKTKKERIQKHDKIQSESARISESTQHE